MSRVLCLLAFVPLLLGAGPARNLRLPVTRDTWFSDVGKEADGSNGGAPQLKVKSIQEMSLIDIDPAPLKGRVVVGATLHVHLSGPEILRRITISSIGADWVEGDATGYAEQPGVSTFNHRLHPDTPWSYSGSNFTSVILGQGGTIWHSADASPPDPDRWQEIPVDPKIVAARVAGISSGFLIFDDTGSEWSREGDRFILHTFPNRFFNSRDSRRVTAPYVTVELGQADTEPPAAPSNLQTDCAGLPAGEARVSWITPPDRGMAGVIGFFVELDGKPAPRYLIPAAGKPGDRVTMHLRDLDLTPGSHVRLSVRAVDGAGNVGQAAALSVKTSSESVTPLPGKNVEPFKGDGPLPKLGDAEIAIIDALDKVQPISGQMIPPQEPSYLSANHLWGGRQIHLFSARKEVISFQILVRGKIRNLTAKLNFGERNSLQEHVHFYAYRDVNSKIGPVPDPLVPVERGKPMLSVPDQTNPIAGQTCCSLLCEIEVPELPAGEQTGVLTLSAEGRDLQIPVTLKIWDFSLPTSLSFLPEMNCYDLPEDEIDYYRLAHRNRVVINRVPYHQNGAMSPGCAPKWDDKTRMLDWTDWDKRFAKYIDGSAFDSDLRKGVPLEVFYLPLFENWPTPMEGNYNGDYWADHAFPGSYKKDFVEVSRQFAQHFNEKGWNQTIFQCFFNGKNNFKLAGWSRGSCPWLLDEPANFQDYWALRFFGSLFHQGINLSPGSAKLLFRADISRPEWQRDVLDPVLDYAVIGGGAFRQYNRMVLDRKLQFGQIVIPYGTSNDPAESNVQPLAWCIDSWTLGGDGVLPWQTIGNDNSWTKADALSLFYPGESMGLTRPVPSIRLKSYLRGEQDVEYLTILANVEKQSRYLLGQRVRAALNLSGQRKGTGYTADEDAGVIDFGSLRPQDLWSLRMRIAQALDAAHPKPMRQLVNFQVPRRATSE